MSTELILIRHGNAVPVNGRYLYAPLTTLGQQQAIRTGQYFYEGHSSLGGFYTSPLRRAKETAAIIGSQISETPKVRNGIRELEALEVPALAFLELLSIFDPVEDYLDAHAGRRIQWPMEGRVSKVLTEIVAIHPNQRVGVVAHSGVISSVLAWFFPEQRLHWWMTMVGNCSLTRLRVDGARAELLAVNETQHLTPVATITQPPARTVQVAKKVLQTEKLLPHQHG
jgi:broad specificity phosphatase PhoE